ncbi:MAG: hypothetical protein ACK4UU_04325, partial [Fimbriimonadales bacterium]
RHRAARRTLLTPMRAWLWTLAVWGSAVAAPPTEPVIRPEDLPRYTPPHAPALSEYVDALAGVYERAAAAQPALETILDDVRRRLCRRLGLPAGATLLQLIQSLPADSPLRDALAQAHRALQHPNLTAEAAARLLQQLEPLIKDV